jgi:hypothetical protein
MKSLPTAPQASRRALLMGFAAAATPMAPALANALSEPAPAVADPIFAVIAEHDAAYEAVIAAFDAHIDDEEITEAAEERSMEAELPLFTTAPTTIAGVAALLAYLGRDARSNPDETILVDATEWGPGAGELPGAVRALPRFLAAALRNIIERGQA